MKNTLAFLFVGIISFASCKKDNNSQNNGSTFTATIDGHNYVFNIISATLLRSQPANEKRLDVTGISTDGSKRLILTLGEETYMGDGVSVKSYNLNAFPEDNPATPDIDESLITEGFTTYSTSLGNDNWLTDVYGSENGTFVVSDCNVTNKTISGTFQSILNYNLATPEYTVTITNGKMNHVKYTVLN